MVVGVIRCGCVQAKSGGDAGSDIVADAVELVNDILLDGRGLKLGGLETNGIDQELLLDRRQGVVEEAWLRPVIVEGR
jgi:hypothetical protein